MLGNIPEDVTGVFYYADMHGYTEVIYELCVPHFYHSICN